MEKRDGFWYVFICDRCKKRLYHERDKLYCGCITERGKKGTLLHFCSEECCKAHRGEEAGNGRIRKVGF